MVGIGAMAFKGLFRVINIHAKRWHFFFFTNRDIGSLRREIT